jgi:hypothetical protein
MTFQQVIQNNPEVIKAFFIANNNQTLTHFNKEYPINPIVEWIKNDVLNQDFRFKYGEYVSSHIFDDTRTVFNQKERNILGERSENAVGKEFSLRLINLYENIGKRLFSKLSVSEKILMSKTFGVMDLGLKVDITSIYKIIDG